VLGAGPEYVKQIDANRKERFSRPVFRSNSIRNYRLKTVTPASSLSKKIVHQKNDHSNLATSMLWKVPRTPDSAQDSTPDDFEINIRPSNNFPIHTQTNLARANFSPA
jgi:hypothetical protein